MKTPPRKDQVAAQDEVAQALRYAANRRKPLVMAIQPARAAHLLSEITLSGPSWMNPGTEEEQAAFARYEDQKRRAIQALQALDSEQLYEALSLYPLPLLRDLLADDAVFGLLTAAWSAALAGHGPPQKLLQAIGKALSFFDRGRKKEHVLDFDKRVVKNQAASRSRSVARWSTRYEKNYLPLYQEPKTAWRQLVGDFTAQAHFADPQDKQLAFQQLRARLAEKYPGLKKVRLPAPAS